MHLIQLHDGIHNTTVVINALQNLQSALSRAVLYIGSESSTLETDVCVWRYAPLVVLATQEEEEEDMAIIYLFFIY